MEIIKITSLDLPALQPYRTLRRSSEHLEQGIFVAEGEKVVRRLLSSGIAVVSMLMTHEWFQKLSAENVFEMSNDVRGMIFLADKSVLETIVGFNLHQGIMAVARTPHTGSIDEIIHRINRPFFFVALDGLVHAENVGVVVRNCAAFGVDAILVGENSSSPFLRRAVRNSMGTVFKLPVIHCTNLIETLTYLQTQYHIEVIGAHPHENNSIHTADLSGNICIVLGNEGDGITPSVLNVCTTAVAIPMMNATDSINVASASAVFLYEVGRQRENKNAGFR